MLNYAPDGMAGGGAAFGEAFALDWMTASRVSAGAPCGPAVAGEDAPAGPAPARPATMAFQPERMSGFCAAG
jgi:hypothetical protein